MITFEQFTERVYKGLKADLTKDAYNRETLKELAKEMIDFGSFHSGYKDPNVLNNHFIGSRTKDDLITRAKHFIKVQDTLGLEPDEVIVWEKYWSYVLKYANDIADDLFELEESLALININKELEKLIIFKLKEKGYSAKLTKDGIVTDTKNKTIEAFQDYVYSIISNSFEKGNKIIIDFVGGNSEEALIDSNLNIQVNPLK